MSNRLPKDVLIKFFATWQSPPNNLPVKQKEIYQEYVELFLSYMKLQGFVFVACEELQELKKVESRFRGLEE